MTALMAIESVPLLVPAARSVASLLLVVALLAPLEAWFAVRRADRFAPGWPVNLGWYFLNGLGTTAILAPVAAALAWFIHSVLPGSVTGLGAQLPLGWRMAAAMLIGELGFYWGHRLSHEIPWLWRFHAIHHSAEHVNFLVNTRAHPVDIIFTRLCGLTLLYATGLASPIGRNPGLIPTLLLVIGSFWSFFIHANIKVRLGWIEALLTTPAFHHWHHSRNDHIDRNYAAMLPIYDRLFGTHYLPRHWPDAYGTDSPVPTDLSAQFLAPFRR